MSAREWCIPLTSPAEWRAALEGIPHAFAHTWEHCAAVRCTTGYDTFLYVRETTSGRMVCPFAERPWGDRVDVVTPPGFPGFTGRGGDATLAADWSAWGRRRGYVCAYIALHPLLADPGWFPAAEVGTVNSLYFLDLTRDPEVIRAGFDRNRRRELRDFAAVEPELVTDRRALSEFLVRQHGPFLERVGAPAGSRFSRATLEHLCALDNVLLVGAAESGRLSAVHAFCHTPGMGDALFNVSVAVGRERTTALFWWGVRRLKQLGVPVLNMGGGAREDDAIARAKQRFGAERRPFHAVKQIFRPDCYERLCREAGVDPRDRTGYFPAYRRPAPDSAPASAETPAESPDHVAV